MTLYIKIYDTDNLKSKGGYLFVEGSQAGLLMSEKVSGSDFKFKIQCSNQDNLFFRYCKSKQKLQKGQIISEGQFHCETFIRKNDKQLRQRCPKHSIEAEILLFDKQDKEAGTLKMKIRYDRVRQYQGEVWSNDEHHRKKIPLYKGTVPHKNLFSAFDPSQKDKQAKWMESNYHDQD